MIRTIFSLMVGWEGNGGREAGRALGISLTIVAYSVAGFKRSSSPVTSKVARRPVSALSYGLYAPALRFRMPGPMHA